MLYFMYIRVKNYEADMKLYVFRWTNILLQYSLCYVMYSTVKNDRFGLRFCFSLETPLRLSR